MPDDARALTPTDSTENARRPGEPPEETPESGGPGRWRSASDGGASRLRGETTDASTAADVGSRVHIGPGTTPRLFVPSATVAVPPEPADTRLSGSDAASADLERSRVAAETSRREQLSTVLVLVDKIVQRNDARTPDTPSAGDPDVPAEVIPLTDATTAMPSENARQNTAVIQEQTAPRPAGVASLVWGLGLPSNRSLVVRLLLMSMVSAVLAWSGASLASWGATGKVIAGLVAALAVPLLRNVPQLLATIAAWGASASAAAPVLLGAAAGRAGRWVMDEHAPAAKGKAAFGMLMTAVALASLGFAVAPVRTWALLLAALDLALLCWFVAVKFLGERPPLWRDVSLCAANALLGLAGNYTVNATDRDGLDAKLTQTLVAVNGLQRDVTEIKFNIVEVLEILRRVESSLMPSAAVLKDLGEAGVAPLTPEDRKLLEAALPQVTSDVRYRILVALGRYADADLEHSRARHEQDLRQARARAALLRAEGDRYYQERRFAEAIAPYREALKFDPTNIAAANRLSLCLMGAATSQTVKTGYQEAAKLLEATWERIKDDLGVAPTVRATVLNNLGFVYRELQRFDDAVRVFTLVVGVYDTWPAGHEAERVNALNNLVAAQADAGLAADSVVTARRLMQLQKQVPNPTDFDTTFYMETLAGALLAEAKQLGDDKKHIESNLTESAELFEKSLATRRTHPEWMDAKELMARTQLNLAGVYKRLGRRSEARAVAAEALAGFPPGPSIRTGKACLMVAGLLDVEHDMTQAQEALDLYTEVESMFPLLSDGPHEVWASALNGKAKALYWLGRKDESCGPATAAAVQAAALWKENDWRRTQIQANKKTYCQE